MTTTMETDGSMPPPVPPARRAVAAGTPDRSPCVSCGHTLSEHLNNGSCRGVGVTVNQGGYVEMRMGGRCGCPRYVERRPS